MKQLISNFKKSASILLACIIALSVFAVGASAKDASWPEYVKYTITDGEAEITSCSCRFTRYETVTIPETVEGCPVTSIKYTAFEHCIYHDTIKLPATIKSIGNRALDGNFKKIEVDENNLYYSSDDYGVLYNKDKTEIVQYPTGKSETSYTVPAGVEKIGNFSFYSSSLTEIVFSDTVKIIGTSAFADCFKLEKANLPQSVTKIETKAFSRCEELEEIFIGSNVSDISVTSTFSGCSKAVFKVDEDNEYFCTDDYGVLYTKDMKKLYKYPEWQETEEYVVPEGVEEFAGSTNLSSDYIRKIFLPSTLKKTTPQEALQYNLNSCNNLETITVSTENKSYSSDENGFLYNKEKTFLIRCPRNTSVKDIVLPSGVTDISSAAFNYCQNVESIFVCEGVEKIPSINYCPSLKKLYLPSSVQYITSNFSGTQNITDIYFAGTQEEWNDIKFSSTSGVFDDVVFHYNYGLTSGSCGEDATWLFNEENGHLTISGSGTIEEKTSFDDYGWYSLRDKITYVEVASGVENVPANAFDGCTELKEVYLSETVSSIGANAFRGCDNLKVVSSVSENPVSLGENAIPANENITIISKGGNTTLASLPESNPVIVSFDEEKKILHFAGDITVYPDVEYNFLNKFMLERTNSEYILFDKVVFEGVRPDFIDPSQFENMEAGATNLTLTNLYVSLKVIQGETERTITFEEMLEHLEEGNFDVFKYVIESEEENGEKPFLVKIGECVVEFAERALRAISSVINFIAKLFKRK